MYIIRSILYAVFAIALGIAVLVFYLINRLEEP